MASLGGLAHAPFSSQVTGPSLPPLTTPRRPLGSASARRACHTQASKEDVMARIARAKQYKSDPNSVSPPPPPASPVSPPGSTPPSAPSSSPTPAPTLQPTAAAATASSPPAAPAPAGTAAADPFLVPLGDGQQLSQEQYVRLVMDSKRGSRQGSGGVDEAASWLQGVLKDGDTEEAKRQADQFTRMEDFSEWKEALKRAEGADIIVGGVVGVRGQAYGEAAAAAAAAVVVPAAEPTTEDAQTSGMAAASSNDAGGASDEQSATEGMTSASSPGDEDPGYQPRVSTWGVFPRPKDMSKAFGGGRNLKPGEALETPEQAAERERSFRTAMERYKKAIGAEVDPAAEEEAAALLEEGNVLMKAGRLQAAYEKFDKATTLMPLKTKIGGQATLQKAICLDSNGESKAAERLYRSLQGHPMAIVSKKARQLLFGFQAMAFMKADQISYAAKKTDWDGYFRKFADRNKVYVASAEDRVTDEAQARLATIIAVLVLVGPLAAFALVALGRT